MNPPFGAVTVVTAAYLPWARALFESLRERHPEAVCAAILVDRPAGRFELAAEPFEVLPVEALGETGLKQLLFRYTRFERVMAFKALGLAAFWKRRPELERSSTSTPTSGSSARSMKRWPCSNRTASSSPRIRCAPFLTRAG
ncbi:MAG: hypothetical protein M5U26_04380 [Planctomycetota bacterium]|nr:hypothetical protein [Planctomycetota bacterium]